MAKQRSIARPVQGPQRLVRTKRISIANADPVSRTFKRLKRVWGK